MGPVQAHDPNGGFGSGALAAVLGSGTFSGVHVNALPSNWSWPESPWRRAFRPCSSTVLAAGRFAQSYSPPHGSREIPRVAAGLNWRVLSACAVDAPAPRTPHQVK